MSMINSLQDIQRLVVEGPDDWKKYGHVSVRYQGDLALFNYTDKATFENRWNFFERVSRGLILNRRTGEIVARPFDKFFNWGEGGRTTDAKLVCVTEKMDGSLGIMYRDPLPPCKLSVATRGLFDSEQAQWATYWLNAHCADRIERSPFANDEWTFLFEIIYPGNQIVVNYGGFAGLVLLAIRNRLTGKYLTDETTAEWGYMLGLSTPRRYVGISEIGRLLASKSTLGANQEGWVAEFADGQRFKIKGDKYMRLHRLISDLSFKSTLEAMMTDTVDSIRSQLPEKHLQTFNAWADEIVATVARVAHEVRAAFDAAPKSSRKEFALWVQAHHAPHAPHLFAMFDGKPIEPIIYRTAFVTRESSG